MRITEVKKFLVDYYFNAPLPRYGVLLLGPPGVGKSEVVVEVASEIADRLGKELVEYDDDVGRRVLQNPERYFVFTDLRLYEYEASDFSGIPRENNGYVEFRPLLWARVMSKCHGLVMLDELTNVNDLSLLPLAYRVVLDKSISWIRMRRDVMVVAAGNPPEWSSLATALPAPLLNRLVKIDVDPPSVDEWYAYMCKRYKDGWERRVYAYLKRFSEDFIATKAQIETLENFPTPRTWTQVALLAANPVFREAPYFQEVVAGLVGQEVAAKLVAFLRINVPSIEEIIKKPELWNQLDVDGKWIISVELGRWLEANPSLADQAGRLVARICAESREYIAVVLNSIRDVSKRFAVVAAIIQSQPDVAKALKDIGSYLISA